MKNNISVILIRPQLGENIGSAARVIKNFGFKKLFIVKPKQKWPNQKAIDTSANAKDILKKVVVSENILDVIKKFDIVFALSARLREIEKQTIDIPNFKRKVIKYKKLKIGLMFGPESSGLTNHDIGYSDYIVKIPTDRNFSSLNLSHAIGIICYEIFNIFNNNKKNSYKKLQLANKNIKLNFIKQLKNNLYQKDYFKNVQKKQFIDQSINNLIYKLKVTNKEIRILHSIISALTKTKKVD